MSKNILELLSSGIILVSDGAMGTELQKRGMKPGTCPELLNATDPELIRAIHKDYFDAGSNIVETNSFGGSRARLAMHQLENRISELAKLAAENAKIVCPPGKFVAGSVGPTGNILEPLGDLSLDKAYDIFAEQLEALAEGGVDIIFIETMMAIEEAEIAVKAAKEKTNLPVAATMTFEAGQSGLRTMWGVDITTAVERLTSAGADIIGSNCGRGFDEMIEVVKAMRSLTSLPILAQANAGIPELINGINVYKETPELISAKVEYLLNERVNIIGGCCGTGPQHIKAIRLLVDKIVNNSLKK
ncbi:MAG: homocysteine S-methyltransferase family protein [Ignavibacteriales bacterium]|nr:homocysteine S-methyltransferase family protein [Ignavibacteriales bacterium]